MPPSESNASLNELEFSRLVEVVRLPLSGYLMSLSLDRDLAEEVFQDTLLYLWRHRTEYEPGTSFRGWAFRCGYFCALSKKRDRFRERTACYSDEFFHHIADHAERHAELAEARLEALRGCLSRLSADEMAVIRRRYGSPDGAPRDTVRDGNPGRFHKAISRLRLRLKICVEKNLKADS